MKRVHQVLALAAAIVFSARAEETHLNGISAIVNETVISRDRVVALSRQELSTAQRVAKNDTEFEKLFKKIVEDTLERLIDRQLILDEFKTKGYPMPESIVDELVREHIRQDFGGDRLNFTKTLREENKTFDDFRREQRESFIIYQMSKKNIAEEIVVSPKKIEKYFAEHQKDFHLNERVKIRMIVLDPSKHEIGGAEKLGKNLVERLRKGEDFPKLADEYSDFNKSTKGGDRGWMERSSLSDELREVAFKMQTNSVEMVSVKGTVFVLKVEDHRLEETQALNDVRIEIEGKLRDAERKRLEAGWLGRLRKKAFVAYF
jgi:parvulin-like peptidyl-prolyl isomerase